MTKKLITVFDYANELKSYVVKTNLSKAEINSFAEAINYSVGLMNKKNRLLFKDELILINAYLGSVVLREYSFTGNIQVPYPTIENIINSYVNLLLRELSNKYSFHKYHDRLNTWTGILNDIHTAEKYNKDISLLADNFYRQITKHSLSKEIKRVLIYRFNSYVDYITKIINKLERNLRYIIQQN